jgi:hypothetical protein
MPTIQELTDLIEPHVQYNVRWLYRRYRRHEGDATTIREASEAFSAEIVARLVAGCSCSERWLPPAHSTDRNFWFAAARCERNHQATLGDLARAGLLQGTSRVVRQADSLEWAADLVCEGNDAAWRMDDSQGWLLTELLQAVIARSFPTAWAYQPDTRFWRAQKTTGAWFVLDEERQAKVNLDLPLPRTLRGFYLGHQVVAELTREGQVVFRGATYPTLEAAAEAARAFVADLLRPHRPADGWQCQPGEQPLQVLHRQFWDAVVAEGFTAEHWLAVVHRRPPTAAGGQPAPVSLEAFLYRAAVGNYLPQAPEFVRSILFDAFSFSDATSLDAGEVLCCDGCGHEIDGSCATCVGHGESPRACPKTRMFLRGSKTPVLASRCGNQDCANYWYGRPACPRCGSSPAGEIEVWRPIARLPMPPDDTRTP